MRCSDGRVNDSVNSPAFVRLLTADMT